MYGIGRSFNEFRFFTSVEVATGLYSPWLHEVTIPSTLKELGGDSFSRCYALYNVIMESDTPPSITSSQFNFHEHIYVPDAALEAYRTANIWSGKADKIKPMSEYQAEHHYEELYYNRSLRNNTGEEIVSGGVCITAFIPVGKDSLTVFTPETAAQLHEYGSDKEHLEYWNLYRGAPRTFTVYNSGTRYIRAGFYSSVLDDCYIYNNTTGEYLFKGKNVN